MAAAKAKRRKSELKDHTIMIRVTEGQKETLATAAKRVGLGLSSWMLSVALAAASDSK
jgi:uncharacterized protein (DUF1778 family)